MKIKSITLKNIRSIEQAKITFSDGINIFIGANNSGKSTILNALLLLQQSAHNPIYNLESLRMGAIQRHLDFELKNHQFVKLNGSWDKHNNLSVNRITLFGVQNQRQVSNPFTLFQPKEPNNIIYFYTSKRKVLKYKTEIGDISSAVTGEFSNLSAKLDYIYDEAIPEYELYKQACQDILGLVISPLSKEKGKIPAYRLNAEHAIEITNMGEGVSHIVGFIIDLCRAQNKIFIIEEPENDLHPKALKALLKLIADKSKDNQFFISTHSNIVVKQLVSLENSNLYRIDMKLVDKIPTSEINLVTTSEDRRNALEDLGYELLDYDLYEGWLILEESSAERIIREHLIRWFTPNLIGRLRTIAADGLSKVELTFESFYKLFLFLHTQPLYHNKAWVVIDEGNEERKIIEKLRQEYKRWDSNHFQQFTEHDFENYYPSEFSDKVQNILSIEDKQAKRKAKKELLHQVLRWIGKNDSQAKEAFAESAKPVISILKQIEQALNKTIEQEGSY